MSLQEYKITDTQIAQKGVVAAPDILTGTAAQNKAVFDRLIREAVKSVFNGLIDALSNGGAGEIGVEAIEGVTGDNVQTILESLKILLDGKEGAAEAAAALLLKADKTETAEHIRTVGFNASTGVFTFTKQNGQTVTIDTLLEKVAINFTYDASTQELVLTLADGTTQRISLSAFITETEFVDSDQIDFSVSSHKVTATIKPGSITDAMLSSGLVTLLQGYVSSAAGSATNASTSAAAAAGSASAASGSAGAAAASAEAAAASETAAAGSASSAAADATAASNSKTAAAGSASTAGTKAQDSEAWAVGKRNGQDVPSSDETYHNNAKYWAGQAQQAAGGGVTSFNGRSGTVVPEEGDYTPEMIGIKPVELRIYADDDTTVVVSHADGIDAQTAESHTTGSDDDSVTESYADFDLSRGGEVEMMFISGGKKYVLKEILADGEKAKIVANTTTAYMSILAKAPANFFATKNNFQFTDEHGTVQTVRKVSYETLASGYVADLDHKNELWHAVRTGMITSAQYTQITGETYPTTPPMRAISV